MRDLRAILPAAGLSASLIFAAVAWNAHHRALKSGETGFAHLFGARDRFDPMDFNPTPLKREAPAPPAVQEASMFQLPAPEVAAHYSRISRDAGSRPEAAFIADRGATVTIYLAPWSAYCHDAVTQVQHLRGELALRGVTTRIVLGLDSQDKLDAFAAEVGGDIVFEPGPETSNPADGVPAFIVADASRVKASRVGAFSSESEASLWALGRLTR